VSTRDRIVDAAAEVMRTRGLARATTKEIAKAAGYSEATLYKHFDNKSELFLSVLGERVPGGMMPLLTELREQAGDGDPRRALTEVALAAVEFYVQTFPMAASLFSEPTLLAAHRQVLAERDTGPHMPNRALAEYLRAERDHGRLPADIDPDAVASLLLGACMQHAFLAHFGHQPGVSAEEFAKALVDTLFRGLGDSA
jgi:AcrR family transcriptional regulator